MKTKTKKDKRNYKLIALVVILLLLAVGYASFSQVLTVTGTAKASATWNVHFLPASSGILNSAGTAVITDTASLSNNTLTIDFTGNELAFPGDQRKVRVVVENTGTLDAKLTGFTFTLGGQTGTVTSGTGTITTQKAIITYLDLDTTGDEVIAKTNGQCIYDFVVQWNPSYNESFSDQTFNIEFTYEQDTTVPGLTPSHNNH